jgi:hypothetical protein
MRHYLILGYPGVIILEMPILLKVYFILLGKQITQICDVKFVVKILLFRILLHWLTI